MIKIVYKNGKVEYFTTNKHEFDEMLQTYVDEGVRIAAGYRGYTDQYYMRILWRV